MPRVAVQTPNWKPRLTIEVTEDQYTRLKSYMVDYGRQAQVFRVIVDDMINMLDQYGQHFFIALLQKDVSYKKFMEDYTDRKKN